MRKLAVAVLALFALVPLSTAALGAKPAAAADQAQPTYITFLDPQIPVAGLASNITVLFNPKEISMDKSVPWSHAPSAHGDSPSPEFTAGKPYSLSVELLFDTFESKEDVGRALLPLLKFAPQGSEAKRPPMVKFVWGSPAGEGPQFDGVISSIEVKYTLFTEDGTPVRATVHLVFEKASEAQPRQHSGPANETRH